MPTLPAARVRALAEQKLTVPDGTVPLWTAQLGLSTLMIDIGQRFATMPFAAAAGDWGTALNDYEEIVSLANTASLLEAQRGAGVGLFVRDALEPLADGLRAQDLDSFNTHLPSAISACNSCHVSSGFAQIVIQPAANFPRESLKLTATKPIGAYVPPPYERPTPPFADTDLLGWQDLSTLLDFYLNTPDLTIPLWMTQRDSGPVMLEYGMRFALMKYAVDAGDWALAQYQYSKAIQAQEADEIREPERVPYYGHFKGYYLSDVKYALDTADSGLFGTSYDQALTGCNACHVSSGHSFLWVVSPTMQPQPLLALSPSKPKGETSPPAPSPTTWPDTPPGETDALNLLLKKMSQPDTDLAMWRTQRSMGNFMWQAGYHFSVAWFAGQAGNWAMADYQLKSIETVNTAAGIVAPDRAAALAALSRDALPTLRAASTAKDKTAFASAFAQTATACNSCHAASGREFIRVQIPTRNPAEYLKF